ncbi:secretory carrier-associated membrane protein 1 [Folsomia candida]|uniref:secretory carrier-associated membrane protein 1 n=1 Tax=Folsomia candida TaxID=158441 RepID=UPI000B8F4F04|nr:secretory carrier-associated membrane protein 1 [Folsomia candida]XP_021950212.1 secretory carrier-associated membrane protein 1 [Folsomia candida]XP_021950219.1 secretory carrier-associated membrane protein 1 [Folsomia candida]
MSGFDDNPFDDNPFKDPAIQQVTRNSANSAAKDLEDYNPFDSNATNQQQVPTVGRASNNSVAFGDSSRSPAVMSPVQETTPVPFGKLDNRSQQPQGQGAQGIPISTEELQRRQEELERKARELERREEELRNNPYNVRRNNWPPLPESFPVQPCFYQDINVDIPVEFQRIVRHLYYLWILHTLVLIANSLVLLLLIFVIHDTDTFMKFCLSLFYIVVFTPMSFICWFRPAYKAFRSDSSFNFMVFFFVFFFQFIIAIMLAIFLTGSCGIMEGVTVVQKGGGWNIFAGVFVILIGLCFLVCALLDLFLLMRVHKIYRSTGASFAKAQQEFASGVIRNEHVQGAAAGIASEAIRQQFRGATSPGNAPPRY